MRIDSHQHFWRYDPEQYPWIDDRMAALRRDFLPEHLAPELEATGIEGTVAVEARPSVAETEWLLSLAATQRFIRGVVGWVPLDSPDVDRELERLASNPLLKGVRHALQGEPDGFMSRSEFDRGIAQLARHHLTYDVLVYERQLPQALDLIDRHPRQLFVVDHLAKPNRQDRRRARWGDQMRLLAMRENCYCKVSGLVTEAAWDRWTVEQLMPYWETVLETFGPDRVAFGSDWPVCLLATTYERWHAVVQRFAEVLSDEEQARVFGKTAAEVYHL
jgi:L-fuconolactonase